MMITNKSSQATVRSRNADFRTNIGDCPHCSGAMTALYRVRGNYIGPATCADCDASMDADKVVNNVRAVVSQSGEYLGLPHYMMRPKRTRRSLVQAGA